jgi:hypothetical protein
MHKHSLWAYGDNFNVKAAGTYSTVFSKVNKGGSSRFIAKNKKLILSRKVIEQVKLILPFVCTKYVIVSHKTQCKCLLFSQQIRNKADDYGIRPYAGA